MKYEVVFPRGEIRLILTESLKLSEGQSANLESAYDRAAFALLPQIQSLVRQFLSGFVEADCSVVPRTPQ